MANKTTEDLNPVSGLSGSEVVHVVQGGQSLKMTLDQLKAFVNDATVTGADLGSPRGASLGMQYNILLDQANGYGVIAWEVIDYDTDNFFSLGAKTRLTVPPGVTKVQFQADLGPATLELHKNGSPTPVASGDTIDTGSLNVKGGDYFEIKATYDGVITAGSDTYFRVDVLETLQ